MAEGFREKTSEELEDQVNLASEKMAQEVTQPSLREEVFNMTLGQIKENFPSRYVKAGIDQRSNYT